MRRSASGNGRLRTMTPDPSSDRLRMAALQRHFPAVDVDAIAVTVAIDRADVILHRKLTERIKDYDLTPVALQTLISVLIADGGPVSLASLGQEIRVTKANVSWVLGRLEDQRLVTREVEPTDGRRIRVHLTKRGRSLLEELVPIARDAMEEVLSGLSKRDRDELRRLLQLIS